MSSLQRSSVPLAEMSRAKSVRKSSITGGVVSHAFPGAAQAVDPSAHLSSLTDNRSNHASVSRSCFQINQFAGADLSVMHDSSYARMSSSVFSALMECVQSHEDRRCRILASKTLAIVARSAYARIRHSPQLFGVRDGTLHRLEDEVGTDVPVCLCTAAMEDADDGVSSVAMEALGILTLSSSAMIGTMVEDEFLREVDTIAHARPSPYAPSLATLSDEDPSIPQMELQSRVYENVLTPRVWRLVRRILYYDSTVHVLRALPFLTACLVHLVKMTPATTIGMDRSTFAKRWIEVDTIGLTRDVVNCLLLPAMKDSLDGNLAHASSLSALRLAHVCPHEVWVRGVCKWSVAVLSEQLTSTQMLQDKLTLLSTLLIAARGLPLTERVRALENTVNEVRFLPSTTVAPAGVTCPGILIGKLYRRPARVGFLAEIALSFLLDGPSDSLRSSPLKDFLSSPEISSILTSRSGKRRKGGRTFGSNLSTTSGNDNSSDRAAAPGGKTPAEDFAGSHVGEELVLAFCQVASAVGERIFETQTPTDRRGHEWLRCSLVILSLCSSCVNWRSRTLENVLPEEDHDSRSLYTMLTAAQASYIQLMVECFYAVGYLSPRSSVTLHISPVSAPSRSLLLEDLAVAISSLAQFNPFKGCAFARKDISTLVDQFLEYKFREGVPSRHTRVSLLALLTDHWVQTLEHQDGTNFNMNDMNARELLTVLSEEISSLTKDLTEGIGVPQVHLNYLDVCVAAVENIALKACDWGRRHGTVRDERESFRRDIAEDADYIISTALVALEGKNLREGDVLDDDDARVMRSQYPMLPVCSDAVKRIQSVRAINDIPDAVYTQVALYSTIVTNAVHDFESRVANAEPGEPHVFAQLDLSPFIASDERVETPLVLGDAHIHAYFVHYSRQVIGSRTDLSLFSSNTANPVKKEEGNTVKVVRSRDFLRLSAPPLPLHRLAEAGVPLASRVGWRGSITTLSGGSDPVNFVLAYAVRRCPRYDCEPEYKLLVTMRVYNTTAVRIAQGVRLDLRVTQQKSAFAVEGEEAESNVLTSATTMHKQEIKAGDHVTWEVSVDNWPMKGTIELHPAVSFREIDAENSGTKLICPIAPGGEEPEEKNDDNTDAGTDLGTDGGSLEERTIGEIDDEAMDVTLTGQPVRLSPMIGLQPCPLVFFRDGHGDENTFRFLWYQMPHRMPAMMLYPAMPGIRAGTKRDDFAAAIASIATIPLDEYIDQMGVATMGWAFLTLSGNRLLCLMIEADNDGDAPRTSTLHFRADDDSLLLSIMGSDAARNSVVASLTKDIWTSQNPMDQAPKT